MQKYKRILIPVSMVLVLLLAVGLTAVLVSRVLPPKEVIVCLDAGHGGEDFGAIGLEERREKDDNLRLTLAVRDELHSRGIKTVLTREDDSFPTLEQRCKIANRRRAALFVSFHRNSAESGHGAEVWVHSLKPKKDTELASAVLSALESVGVSGTRGVKFGYRGEANSNYYVNSNTKMPSCLVEVGFVTDQQDNTLFDTHLQDYARAIAGAIETTLNAD